MAISPTRLQKKIASQRQTLTQHSLRIAAKGVCLWFGSAGVGKEGAVDSKRGVIYWIFGMCKFGPRRVAWGPQRGAGGLQSGPAPLEAASNGPRNAPEIPFVLRGVCSSCDVPRQPRAGVEYGDP